MYLPLLAIVICSGLCQAQSTFSFSQNNYQAYENSGTVTIIVRRTGDTSGAASVRVITEASTALAGSDYSSENRVVDFVPGDTQESIEIGIVDDNVADEEETFLVRLSDPSGGVLGNPAATVVNINEGAAPSSSGLADEILIAIIVASVAAILILLLCCVLIYCLRFRRKQTYADQEVFYRDDRREPEPAPLPNVFRPRTPPPQRRPYTPPPDRRTPPFVTRPYTPPPRSRTPPPFTNTNGNTQVTVINEPSPPIIEPPPPKPTQVIVIRPQTPEIIRHRPARDDTEVIVRRPRPRSASPRFHRDDREEYIIVEERPPSPVETIIRRVIRPRARRHQTEQYGEDFGFGGHHQGGFAQREVRTTPYSPAFGAAHMGPLGPVGAVGFGGPSAFSAGPLPTFGGPSVFRSGPAAAGQGYGGFSAGPPNFGPANFGRPQPFNPQQQFGPQSFAPQPFGPQEFRAQPFGPQPFRPQPFGPQPFGPQQRPSILPPPGLY